MKNKKLFWIYLISSITYFLQGIEGLPGLSFFAYLKDQLGFTPEKIMWISSIITIPWIIKPLEGFFIDNYFSKKTWILLSLIGSISVSLFFGLSPFLAIPLIITIMMVGNFNTAFRDISCDALMCETGKENNKCDKIQVVQWISITIAGIIVGLAGGWIADHSTYKIGFLCLIPIYLIASLIVSKYDTVVPKNSTFKISKNNFINILKLLIIIAIWAWIFISFSKFPNNNIFDLCFKNSAIALCLFCFIYFGLIPYYKLIKNTSFIKSIYSYKELFTDKKFLFACLFIFLYNFSPSFGTPLQFIERDKFGWSWQFMGILGAITSGISILGAIIYFKISSKINVKKCLIWSVFIGALTTLCYLWFNPVSAILYGIVFSGIGMFIFLNIMTLMAKNTVNGKEATSFACLCGINNLAGTCSSMAGAWLFPLVGLKWLIILSAITSFLCLPLIKRLEIK